MDKEQLTSRFICDAAATIRCAALSLQSIPMDSPLEDAASKVTAQLYDLSETLYILAGREDLIPEMEEEE